MLRLRCSCLVQMFEVQIKLLFLQVLIHLYIKFFIKLFHKANVIHGVPYVRPVNFHQELVALSVAYPLQQSLISFGLNFLWVVWINLSSVLSLKHVLTRLVDVIRHHHLIHHHILKSSSFLRCVRLNHLLLDYQLLFRWQISKFLLCQTMRKHWYLRELHLERCHSIRNTSTRSRQYLRMCPILLLWISTLRHHHFLLHHHLLFILFS